MTEEKKDNRGEGSGAPPLINIADGEGDLGDKLLAQSINQDKK